MTRSLALVALLSLPAYAAIVSKPIPYEIGKTQFEGVLIYDDAVKTPRPGLVVIPNWMGINPANIKQAEGLAGQKYVLFVADMYGKAARPKDADAAGKVSGQVKGDRKLMRERVNKALDVLKAQNKIVAVDAKKLGAFGFCFGGTTALELARSGADVAAVVSVHGGLDTPNADDAKNFHGKVLVLHGADDPFVPAKDVEAFENEMRNAKLDWELVKLGNAVHGFTDVDANMDGKVKYNPTATKRAYEMLNTFFDEAFSSTVAAK